MAQHIVTSKYKDAGDLTQKSPLLGFLSRLVSVPPEKPQRAQNEAHTAPQQRYGFPIVITWPLRTGNNLASPSSTSQWGP